nr:hypothetical protein GCM10020092_106790 [Actinoplanes digitatis]
MSRPLGVDDGEHVRGALHQCPVAFLGAFQGAPGPFGPGSAESEVAQPETAQEQKNGGGDVRVGRGHHRRYDAELDGGLDRNGRQHGDHGC